MKFLGRILLALAVVLPIGFSILTLRLLADPGWGQQAAEVRYLSLPHQSPDLQPYQVYEGLLLKMGEKGNDGGQFFTPREVIRVVVRAIDPKIGETVWHGNTLTGQETYGGLFQDAPALFDGWELIHAIAPDLTLYGIALAYANHHIKHKT